MLIIVNFELLLKSSASPNSDSNSDRILVKKVDEFSVSFETLLDPFLCPANSSRVSSQRIKT